MGREPKGQDHELGGIELLRFLCALAILLWHYQHFLFFAPLIHPAGPEMRATFPLYRVLFLAYDHGDLAVPAFWAISGYIFYWRYAQPINSHRSGLADFSVRRFSRLYPLHFSTLLAVAALQYAYFSTHGTTFIYADNGAKAFGLQLLFASNWFSWQGFSFNGPIWSVSAEILIYFAFFGVVRFLGSNALIATLAAGSSWALMKFHISFLSEFIPTCGLFFFSGGLAQRLCRGPLALALSAVVVTVTCVLFASGVIEPNHKWTLILAVSAVVLFAQLSTTRANVILKPISPLGNATYSSYLLHFPIQLLIVTCVDGWGIGRAWLFNPPGLLAYLLLVIACSIAVYHGFEKPAQDWLRLQYSRRVTVPRIPSASEAAHSDGLQ
jgi:peptidoglycan/LPS O-acetylase OafA/YrhL